MGYRVLRYDTSATVERKQLLSPNQGISSLHVLQVPSGADLALAIGSAEAFPIFAGFVVDFCPVEMGEVLLSSAAAVPGEVLLLAWFDGGLSGGAP